METQLLKKRYAVQKQLGKNAGRRTLLARDIETQDLVVIKLLMFGEEFQWETLKLFEREARTLGMLSHPAIPHYLDYFDLDTTSGQGFGLVQSYIPAKSLEQWLKSGRTFSENEVKQLARQLLEILIYLHGQQPQVIHRDIKPSNILLGNRSGHNVGQVYLVDFGSVQTLAAQKGSTITVVGTYGYMPPEQFGGRTVPASDLYSLGATLIYLVTGQHPAELAQDNLRIQFESAANLSPDTIHWLKSMTEPSLNRRLKSAGEALKALTQPHPNVSLSAAKPVLFETQVKVKKQGGTLEIFIPPKMLSLQEKIYTLSGLLGLSSIALSSLYIGIVELAESGFLYSNWFVNLSFFITILVCILFWCYKLSQRVFSSTRLYLSAEQSWLMREKPWGKWQKEMISKEDTKKIIHLLSVSYLTPPEIDWLTRELSEWTGEPITPPEIDWLTRELSEWAGESIPLKKPERND